MINASSRTQPVDEFHIRLGIVLKEARQARGLTQRELALRVGLHSRSVIANWERGRNGMPVHTFVKYIWALGVSPNSIFNALRDDEGIF